jgi:hypothetical protein
VTTRCAICTRRLNRSDALPFGAGKAHFRCVAGLQAQHVIPIETARRVSPANNNARG